MDSYTFLDPSSISGNLKTIYLFLKGQRLLQTCKTLLEESSHLGYPNIKSAIANVLVLKPSFTEIVKVTHADRTCIAVEIKKNPPNTREDSIIVSPENPKHSDGEHLTSVMETSPGRNTTETVPQVANEIKDIQIVQTVVDQEKIISPESVRAERTSQMANVAIETEKPSSDFSERRESLRFSAGSEELINVTNAVSPRESDNRKIKVTMSRVVLGGIHVIRDAETSVSNVKSSLTKVAIVNIGDLKSVATEYTEETAREESMFDYDTVKYDLKFGDVTQRLLLLQALRWKLTQSPLKERQVILKDFTQHDLLGLHDGKEPSPMAACFYNPELQEEMARLVNALASSSIGRNYLAQDDATLRMMLPAVMETDSAMSTAREHILVSLQKLSLRKKMRTTMIDNDLPLYLVYFLMEHHNHISDYCLEYTCALLMNLCLHDEARAELLTISSEVVCMLNDIVKSPHIHCLSYINGVMYSLFCESDIRNKAKESDLQKSLTEVMEQCDEEIKQQVELILDILNGSSMPQNIDASSIGEDIELDHFESEIDLGDVIHDTPNGDELLAQYKTKDACDEFTTPVGIHDVTSNNDSNVPDEPIPHPTTSMISEERQVPSSSKETTPNRQSQSKAGKTSPSSRSPSSCKKCAVSNKKTSAKRSNGKSVNSPKSKQATERTYLTSCPTEPAFRQSISTRCQIDPYCSKYDGGSKYSCICYDEMQNFIKNMCTNNCPGRKRCNSKYQKPTTTCTDEDLFQSAVELLALNGCKSVGEESIHIDCECYTTIFLSRPKVMRTP